MPISLSWIEVTVALLGLYIVKRWISHPIAPLPPGPRAWPLIGNLLDMPTSQEWLTFAKWGKKYGPICSISVLGQQIVILNSAKQAMDILEKKSSIYSNRPAMPMGELVGWGDMLLLIPPQSDRFRSIRKLFHKTVGNANAMASFYPIEEEETRKFVKRILSDPDGVAGHVRKLAGAMILRVSYGYNIKEENDPFIDLSDQAMMHFSAATAPGGFLVNIIPALRFMPDWIPGAGFHHKAKAWKKTLHEMVDRPYQFVKQKMEAGTAEPSLSSRLLSETIDLTPTREHEIKWSAAAFYSGGADTSVASIHSLFIAMILFPEVMSKAQKELDEVIGHDRLPSCSDRDNLPYTNALALEVFRWHTVAPTGVPHTAVEDHVHEGYLIPKGSIIIPNIWKMLHDESVYKDPFRFNPERFLGPDPEPDPTNLCFGFGRRICPGRLFAESSVFIVCAMTLATCNIEKYKLQDGKIIEPAHEQATGTISHPKPFKCFISPRRPNVGDVLGSDEAY
ncbi:cytochrome P450 [Panaeolus papilionaceus]|nr:cytochrome P450 [Panaeolus papilionaceus]